jgi:hypothetical protein
VELITKHLILTFRFQIACVKGNILYLITEIDPISDHKSDFYIAICFRSMDRTTVSRTEFSKSPFGFGDTSPMNCQSQFSNNLNRTPTGNVGIGTVGKSTIPPADKKTISTESPEKMESSGVSEVLFRCKGFFNDFLTYPSSPELIRNKSVEKT